MTIDIKAEYRRILRKAIKGVKRRGFWFGYDSDSVKYYIKRHEDELTNLEMNASEFGQRVHTRENLTLDAKFFSLRVKADMARQGIPI